MTDPSTFLSAEVITKRRTPRELKEWVSTVFDRYRESDEAKAHLRDKKGLCKQLVEEVWPLALLAKQFFGDTDKVFCQPVLGNQNYDALIEDGRCEAPIQIKVEFTIAIDGYDEHLRMEVLNERGRVSAYGEVSVSGTKHTGHKIDIEPSGRDRHQLAGVAVGVLTEALRGKADRPYGLNHWLCVMFDDRVLIPNKDDLEVIRASMLASRQALTLNFAKVFIVGKSGELLWDLT
jgi:hypothetical protein